MFVMIGICVGISIFAFVVAINECCSEEEKNHG